MPLIDIFHIQQAEGYPGVTIIAQYDRQAGCYLGSSPQVPGIHVEAYSVSEAVRLVEALLPEFLDESLTWLDVACFTLGAVVISSFVYWLVPHLIG